MANEISIDTRLSWSRGGAEIIAKVNNKEDQIGTTAIERIQIIGSTSEPIDFGDVTDPSHAFFKNENKAWKSLTAAEQLPYGTQANYEAANTVNIDTNNPATAGTASLKLKPQQGQPLVNPAAAWYALSNADNVNLLVVAVQR
jgi:hypothetical protein